jgi:1-hydroxycarotenoid 3,4-desaturase
VQTPRVTVIGAGAGGLTAAIDLARRGAAVTVLERAPTPGGKIRQQRGIDAGPTVFTMRWVFDSLFADAGTSLDAQVGLQALDVLARHAWSDHETLDLFASIDRSADAIGAFAGPAEAAGYRSFCARAQRVYRTLEAPFIRAPRPTALSLASGALASGALASGALASGALASGALAGGALANGALAGGALANGALAGGAGLRGLTDLWGVSPFATLWRALGKHFRDPRLRQLFGRYATYSGASPFQAPATLMLIAHVEQQGVWLVQGGMIRLAEAMADLATRQGASLRYNADVTEILVKNRRAIGVRLASGERIESDAVVANTDFAALSAGLLGSAVDGAVPRVRPADRSLSALTWTLSAVTDGFPLTRHNVFFSRDYAAEFEAIFRHGRLPAEPTVYVCAQDRAKGDVLPAGAPERLLILVNAPALGDRQAFTAAEIEPCATATFGLLARCGLTVARQPGAMEVTTPAAFAKLFPATGGALYGQAVHGAMAAFRRPGSRSAIAGLYLAGGSVHPGPGVPMAVLSGRLAATSLLADLTSA